MNAPAYAELMVTSNFSFLRSGSHPEELVSAAMAMGLSGLGIADRTVSQHLTSGIAALANLFHDDPTDQGEKS